MCRVLHRFSNWNDACKGRDNTTIWQYQEAFKSALEQTNNNQLILACSSFHTLEAIWGIWKNVSMNNKQRWMGGVVLLGGGVLLAALLLKK